MKNHRSRRAAAGRTFVRDYLSYLLIQPGYHGSESGMGLRL